MWSKVLKFAIEFAVSSGLASKAKDKIVGWLKRKFDKAAEKAEQKLDLKRIDLYHDMAVVRKVAETK